MLFLIFLFSAFIRENIAAVPILNLCFMDLIGVQKLLNRVHSAPESRAYPFLQNRFQKT